MGVQCWTRVVTDSFENCSYSSLHSGLCARRRHYASIWCHCCIKYPKCESLKQFHRKAPPWILEYRVYHKSYAKCKQDEWHGMHVSDFTQNTTWKEQIISVFENTFRKRLIAIKTYCPLRCDAMYSCREVPMFQRNLLLHLLPQRWRQQVFSRMLVALYHYMISHSRRQKSS